jgi:thiosulfate/3-mercaptopyruvate sulfurtransferase
MDSRGFHLETTGGHGDDVSQPILNSTMSDKFSAYSDPTVLVSTTWLAEHLGDADLRIVESNEDVLLYDTGHLEGAVHIDWRRDLNDQTVRDYVGPTGFAALCARHGITPETTVVFYGDKSNWWACYAFWVFQLFGHTNAKVLDGGRAKWVAEGRPMTRVVPQPVAVFYPTPAKRDDAAHRAYFAEALAHMQAGKPMIDVRSPGEYSGAVTHMPEYPQEGVLRGGHIPNAQSCPWATAANADGTFKTAEELRAIYTEKLGLAKSDDIIAYCRIGERSSHTWFVLKYLLGYPQVRNYDGSWTEWGNMVRSPIEKSPGVV